MTDRIVVALAGVLVLSGCLQVESAPPAGSLAVELVSVGLDAESAFVTEDGWTVTLERAALSMGEVRLLGERCNQYSENSYLRVFDLRRPEVQRVVLSFARGECEIGFAAFTPANDAVIGAGIDAETVAFMRTAGSDPFEQERGVTFLVDGRGERNGSTVRFEWPFRQAFDFSCPRVQFEADVARTLRLEARVPALLQFGGAGGAVLFDPIADADADADGEVTIDELAVAPPAGGGTGSLGNQLYFARVQEVVTLAEGGRCDVRPVEIGRKRD